jgi:hypothetical protein
MACVRSMSVVRAVTLCASSQHEAWCSERSVSRAGRSQTCTETSVPKAEEWLRRPDFFEEVPEPIYTARYNLIQMYGEEMALRAIMNRTMKEEEEGNDTTPSKPHLSRVSSCIDPPRQQIDTAVFIDIRNLASPVPTRSRTGTPLMTYARDARSA